MIVTMADEVSPYLNGGACFGNAQIWFKLRMNQRFMSFFLEAVMRPGLDDDHTKADISQHFSSCYPAIMQHSEIVTMPPKKS